MKLNIARYITSLECWSMNEKCSLELQGTWLTHVQEECLLVRSQKQYLKIYMNKQHWYNISTKQNIPLTFGMLCNKFTRRHFKIFFLLFPGNRIWDFRQIVSKRQFAWNLKSYFLEKIRNIASVCRLLNLFIACISVNILSIINQNVEREKKVTLLNCLISTLIYST